MHNKLKSVLCLGVMAAFLSGCGLFKEAEDPPLPGTRISILELQKTLEPSLEAEEGEQIEIPKAWLNAAWPQAGGYPMHTLQNLAFSSATPKILWRTKIGDGVGKKTPLQSNIVVANNTVFVLDTNGRLTAVSAETGKEKWEMTLTETDLEEESLLGGGLAYDSGRLYVATGNAYIDIIDAIEGKALSRLPVGTPTRSAPTVSGGRVYAVTIDNRILAFDAKTEQPLWDYVGIGESAGLLGAASPAVERDIVIPAFSSGEIVALRVENGAQAWSDNLAPVVRFGGLEALSDIVGMPVADKDLVIAGSYGGRMAAISLRTGRRVWQREVGVFRTPWVAGNGVFVVTPDNQLVGLSRDNGAIRWVTKLEQFEDPEDKDGAIFWTAPILAAGRLILFSTHEQMIEVDPQTGEITSNTDIGFGVQSSPAIAGGRLYVLSQDGKLAALK